MPESDQKLSRRKVVAGVGTAGALAAVAVAVPMSRSGETPSVAAAASTAERGEESGYRLTDHVKNYYRTARV
jgi:orotate phosphoribosyltransferase